MMHIVVAFIVAIIFGLLSHKASGQELPDGVTLGGDGTYYVQRRVLRKYTRKQIKALKALADSNNIQYKLVGKK